ncbi:serpin family protein [Candidatus Dojkabacteria bacterium]|nr:serpin family protein [Candidatus Dojkabacteria bacterium]
MEFIDKKSPAKGNSSTTMAIAVFVVLLFFLFLGLLFINRYKSSQIEIENGKPTVTVEPTETHSEIDIEEMIPPSPLDENLLITSHSAFAFNLFKKLTDSAQNKNIFVSPLSISLALSMPLNGAQGETRQTILDVLAMTQLTSEEINKESKKIIDYLQKQADIDISIANSIWIREGYKINNKFLDVNQENFDAEVASINFDSEQAVELINSWVDKNTNNKIQKIVEFPIESDVIMYLINAVYFKGIWKYEFNSELTENKSFKNTDGSESQVPMMQLEKEFEYFENEEIQVVSLKYGETEKVEMIIVLPKDEMDAFLDSFSIKSFNEFTDSFEKSKGKIILPRFKMDYSKSLNNMLQDMGMEVAFTPGADFSLMREENDLYISEVRHKAFIEINEKGTEASAATSVEMALKAVPETVEDPFYMIMDKPFVFVIQDAESGEIFFIGQVNKL